MTTNKKDEVVYEVATRRLGRFGEERIPKLREAVIQLLYALTGQRRLEIRLDELGCITDWSSSKLDRNLGERQPTNPNSGLSGREELYGTTVKATAIGKGNNTPIQCYDLDKVDAWLEQDYKDAWDEIHEIVEADPVKLTPLSKIKDIVHATSVPLAVLLDLKGQVERIADHLDTLIRHAQAGKPIGFMTLAEAMTQYTWAESKPREQARKVWLRVLDIGQQQIEKWREMDRGYAAKTDKIVLERTLPLARHGDRRPPRP